MKRLLVILLFSLVFNHATAQVQPDCANDSRRQTLGDYCMIIVPEGFIDVIPGYYAIGEYIEFIAADGQGEIGRIYAYGWIAAEQRYHYYVITRIGVGNVIHPLTLVSPNVILRSSADE